MDEPTPVTPMPISQLGAGANSFEVALAHAHDLLNQAGEYLHSIGTINDADPLFAECIWQYAKYYSLAHRMPPYRDWTAQGHDELNYGVVGARIPSSARVAILSDWGSGLDDARLLLERLLLTEHPEVLIHLGDVYYSGTPAEFQHNVSGVIRDLVSGHSELGRGPLVYAIPGNHDYYSGGSAFYQFIDTINSGQAPSAHQTASYFCLRTEDGRMQFLGADTGINDRHPSVLFNKLGVAPSVRDSEATWLRDKLMFEGETILLSHHQPFSRHSMLNGPDSGRAPYLNEGLLDVFRHGLDRVPLWFWGHEHCLMQFEDQFGVRRGRLVGCSAFEATPGEDPYSDAFPVVKVTPIRLGRTASVYNHGCAIVDLGARAVRYYQFPAWTGPVPPVPDVHLSEITEAHERY